MKMTDTTAPSVTEAEMPAVDAVTAVQSITANLNDLKQSEAALRAQLAELQAQAVAGAVEQTLALIASVGCTTEKFVALLMPAKKGRKSKGTGERRSAPVVTLVMKDNPELRYVRGVMPGWMKDKIVAAGGDPANKKDRDSFKEQYMQAAA